MSNVTPHRVGGCKRRLKMPKITLDVEHDTGQGYTAVIQYGTIKQTDTNDCFCGWWRRALGAHLKPCRPRQTLVIFQERPNDGEQ